MEINFKKTILLTGAGFTANFGGLLAREMWSTIINNPKIDQLAAVKKLLRSNFDFESVYATIKRDQRVSSTDKDLFQQIILESYSSMDETLKNYRSTGSDPYGVNFYGIGELFASLSGAARETGVHFTLNQDLFLERRTKIVPLGLPAYHYRGYHEAIQLGSVDPNQPIHLPDNEFLTQFKGTHLSSIGNFCYIKLHGSHGWQSSDGSNQMILGNNKLEDISREPLLNWYLELFKQAIFREDVRLFVIGYSFRDDHINSLLLEAAERFKLKIYIVSPEDPERLKNRLEGRPADLGASWERSRNYGIWEAVAGYFPYKLRDIFPSDQSVNHISKDLKRAIAG